jgi:hypothetical protein
MTGWLFALSGAFAGAAQAGLLARSARGVPDLFSFLIRLILVAAVLFLAARAGHLPLGAAGWLLGFAASVAILHRWLR